MSEELIKIVNGKKRRTRVDVFAIKGDQILACQRKDGELYELPGGGLDVGETLEEAALRELMEEAGWVGNDAKIITLPTGDWTFRGMDDVWFTQRGGWEEEDNFPVLVNPVKWEPDDRYASQNDQLLFTMVPIEEVYTNAKLFANSPNTRYRKVLWARMREIVLRQFISFPVKPSVFSLW